MFTQSHKISALVMERHGPPLALPAFGSAWDARLRHTADMLTLITTRERKGGMGVETRGDEGEIRGIRESGKEGWMKQQGGWRKETNWERVVDGKKGVVNKRRCRGEERDDKDEEGRQKGSPDGPVVVLEELWLVVGEEVVWLTRGGEEPVSGISGRFVADESVSLTSLSNGSGGEKEKERKETI